MRGEHAGQRMMCNVGFGRHHDARGVLVQPMDYTRAHNPANAGQAVAAMGNQGIDQRAGQRTRCRMHHHTGGFVQHDDMRVFIQHIKRDVLGFGGGIDRWW